MAPSNSNLSLPLHPPASTTSNDEEDYDVYLFYPSRNQIYQRARQSSWEPSWDDGLWSSSDVSDPSSPTYSYDSDFVYPNPADDHGISVFGYSSLFRRGLWAQSRRISRRFDDFVAKIINAWRCLKMCFGRRAHSTSPV
ncbi:hypothetical protein DICSQDRAFT_179580 [Dichomitus squalens LYAD-421 SS1]|uniref:uncharacterized protein n=1 Tax=Dichomitus squalens (strain LYAD-421) TaxID=732165 RepID=UPI000441376B|nr:uncharacterized protein DICSQDRAFT_179580 [Dichomitus squalens LYAD-421 SS1]EJF62877.1 hypothetical protein DICSQDRAFT_179580 [Dichomitus squalens LYAD-421 SS1]